MKIIYKDTTNTEHIRLASSQEGKLLLARIKEAQNRLELTQKASCKAKKNIKVNNKYQEA